MNKKIPQRIKELRTALAMSAEEFATKTPNLTTSTLNKVEQGQIPASEKAVNAICDFWEVPKEWLTEGKGALTYNKQKKDPVAADLYRDALYKEQKEFIEELKVDKNELKQDKEHWKQKCDQLLSMLGQAMSGKLGKLKSLVPAGLLPEKEESRTRVRM